MSSASTIIGRLVALLDLDSGNLDKGLQGATNKIKKSTSIWNKQFSLIGTAFDVMIAKAMVVDPILGVGKALIQAGREVDAYNSLLKTATGSEEDAAQAKRFLREESERLGLVYWDQIRNYGQLAAATKNTALEGEETRKIWSAMAETATALRMSQNDVSGSMRALIQMISKGRISSEELRQQLGERLPGAFRLAADAMGMTTDELNKALEQGLVDSEEFLMKFQKAMHDAYAGDAMDAAEGFTAQLNRLETAWKDLSHEFMEKGGIEAITLSLEAILPMVQKLVPLVRDLAGWWAEWVRGPSWEDDMRSKIGKMKRAVEMAEVELKVKGGRFTIGGLSAEEKVALQERINNLQSEIALHEKALVLKEKQERDAGIAAATERLKRQRAREAEEKARKKSKPPKEEARTKVDEKALKAAQKLQEQWERTKQSLERKIALTGLEGYERELKQLEFDISDLRQEFGDKPIIATFEMVMKSQLEKEEIKRKQEEYLQEWESEWESLQDDWRAETMTEYEYEKSYINELYQKRIEYFSQQKNNFSDLAKTHEWYRATTSRLDEEYWQDIKENSLKIAVSVGEGYKKLLKETNEEHKQFIRDLIRESDDGISGMMLAFEEYGESAKKTSVEVEGAFSRAIYSMEDAFVEYCRTGKANFSDFAESLMADILRIYIRSQILQPIMEGMSEGNWVTEALGYGLKLIGLGGSQGWVADTNASFTDMMGGPSFYSPDTYMAKGGVLSGIGGYSNQIVSKPTLFAFAKGGQNLGLMGEAGKEAIMPTVGGAGNEIFALLGDMLISLPLGRTSGGDLAAMIPEALLAMRPNDGAGAMEGDLTKFAKGGVPSSNNPVADTFLKWGAFAAQRPSPRETFMSKIAMMAEGGFFKSPKAALGERLAGLMQSGWGQKASSGARAALQSPLPSGHPLPGFIAGIGGAISSGALSVKGSSLAPPTGDSSIGASLASVISNQKAPTKFAHGGIISSPTFFPMAGEHGITPMAAGGVIAGEKGKEAVMPLAKMPSGNLGVEATMLTPGVNIVVNNNAPGAQARVEDHGGMNFEVIVEQVENSIAGRAQRGTGIGPWLDGRYRRTT